MNTSKWLNYQHLYYFYVIAQEGGIARASARLRVGQPALSVQLKQLEEFFGYPLFDRAHRRLYLNERGRLILEYASEIFRLGTELLDAASDRAVEHRINVQVGAIDGLPKAVLNRLVLSALDVGNCFVSMLEGDAESLFRDLRKHELDIVLSNNPPTVGVSKAYFSKCVGELAVAVFGTAEHRSLKRSFPRSLEGQPFVLPTAHSKLRHDLDQYFREQKITLRPIAESQDSALQKMIARSGRALICASDDGAADDRVDGELIKLGVLKGVSEQLWLSTTPRRVHNPIAEALMQTFSFRSQQKD